MTNIKGDMNNLMKNSVNFISGQLIFCVESGGHIQNSPETFHFVPFGMPGRQVLPIFLFFPIFFLFFETIPIYSYFGVKIPIFSYFFDF